ncbi:MAG: ATPase, T2SS/T4P/T4SS family [Acidimicrobiales bacterium]
MKLRRGAIDEAVVQLPRTRLIPDPRQAALDLPRFASQLIGAAGGAVDPRQIERLFVDYSLTGGSLRRMLVVEGGTDERTFAYTVARQLQIPLANLRDEAPSAAATAWVAAGDAHRLSVLPMSYDGSTLMVAVLDPFDAEVLQLLESLAVPQVALAIALEFEMAASINTAYPALAEVGHHLEEFAKSDVGSALSDAAELFTDVGDDDAPVIQVVNKIVTQALRERSSDVHIEPVDDRVRVRFRIDGRLKEVLALPVNIGPALVSRIKIMAGMNIIERRRPQDGQFQLTVDGRDLDVRVSTTATIWGEKTVMRLLDKSRSLHRLGDLGMPNDTHEIYSRIVQSPFGMVIVSGPTGSGKTTTLYATLTEINRPDINVTTIEDPVEYIFPSINQIQISEQAGLTFATGLKSILRQDPDVILVGEVRDVETARIAVQSALTGHLVLSSVHAIDSVSALYRLLDMGIESFLVTSSIIGVVAQRLVRRICPSCKETYQPTALEVTTFRRMAGESLGEWVRGAGCNFCTGTGFHGRIGVYEVLAVNDDIRALVVAGHTPREARAAAVAKGLRTLQMEAVRLVQEGHTTIDEVVRHVFVTEDLA